MSEATEATREAMESALAVIVKDPGTAKWLSDNDPQALLQCRRALNHIREPGSVHNAVAAHVSLPDDIGDLSAWSPVGARVVALVLCAANLAQLMDETSERERMWDAVVDTASVWYYG